MQRPGHRLGHGGILQLSFFIAHGLVVDISPRLWSCPQESLPQLLSPIVGPFFADCPQKLREKPMNLVLDLNEPRRISPCVPAQGLRDKGQTNPLVRLPPTHGP